MQLAEGTYGRKNCYAKVDVGVQDYQYHLKDHLGNVRVTFTTKDEVDSAVATMETSQVTEEQSQFLYYDEAVKINFPLFNHTQGDTTYYTNRLMGADSLQQFGLAKSLSVMPGDTIRTWVFAKYLDTDDGNWTTALTNFIGMLTGGSAPPGTIVDGGFMGTTGGEIPWNAGMLNADKSGETGDAPMAFLNWLVFDREYNFLDGGYERISENAKEDGTGVPFDSLGAEIPITQAGYVYVYLSNDSQTESEVYFDDMSVVHIKSPIIQMDDYTPFGLAFNSYQRENSVPNKFKFGGKEEQRDLALNTIDWGWRQYDPAIGRWNVVDQWAEKYHTTSPYAFVANNPILNREIDGRWFDEKNEKKAAKIERQAEKRADKLEAKANKLEAKGKDSGDLRARAGELRQSGQDIKDMRGNKETEFRYAKASDKSNPAGVGNPTTERTGTNQVTMFTEKNMGSKLHEGRHGGQESRGELGANYEKYGVRDEVSAYRAQYAYDGKMTYVPQTDFNNPANLIKLVGGVQAFQQTITNINQITPALVNTLVDSPGLNQQLIYPPQGISIQQWNDN